MNNPVHSCLLPTTRVVLALPSPFNLVTSAVPTMLSYVNRYVQTGTNRFAGKYVKLVGTDDGGTAIEIMPDSHARDQVCAR